VLMGSGRLNVAHPILLFEFLHSIKPQGLNVKQISTFTNFQVELLFHVTQGFGYNFILDHWNTIFIGFVSMI